jgi:hypothetical protein
MTVPNFSSYAASLPNPKADRWDELVAKGMAPEQATQAVEQEFTTRAKAAPAIARRGESGIASQLTQGASFGFGDEANALVDTFTDKVRGRESRPFGEAYRANADAERARLDMYRQQNGGKSVLAQIAGGVLTGGGVAGLARTGLMRGGAAAAADVIPGSARPIAALLGRAGKGAAEGAAYGALGGAGNSEGNDVSVMLKDAAMGGAVGAGLGGGLPLAGALLGMAPRAGRAVIGAVRPGTFARTEQTAAQAAPGAAPAVESALPPAAPALPAPASAPVQSAGAQAAAQVTNQTPVTDRAMLRLARALREGGMTPEGLKGAAANAKPSEIVADIAGEPARRLVRGAEAIPSRGGDELRTILTERQAGQGDRVTEAVAGMFGLQGRPNLVTGARELAQAQREEAAPLYRAAMMEGDVDRMVPASVLEPFKGVPEFQKALTRAQRMFADDVRQGRAEAGDVFADVVTGVGADGSPQVSVNAQQIPLRVVDYVKKSLDAMIGDRTPAGAMDRTARASLIRDRNALLKSVDELVPEYGTARDAYRGGAALRDAFDSGADAVKMTRDELADELGRMSKGEAQQFRIGAVGRLLEDVQSRADGQDAMAVLAKNRVVRDKIRMLLPSDAARESFDALVSSEARQTATRRTIQGSRTAPLLQDIAALADDPTPATNALSGGMTNLAGRAVGMASDRLMAAERTQMADELAPLLSMSPNQVTALLERLAKAAERQTTRQSAARGATTGAASAVAGQQVRP